MSFYNRWISCPSALYSASATFTFSRMLLAFLPGEVRASCNCMTCFPFQRTSASLHFRFGRRKTIVHRTICALPEATSAGGLTSTTDTSLFLTTYGTPLKSPYFTQKRYKIKYIYVFYATIYRM